MKRSGTRERRLNLGTGDLARWTNIPQQTLITWDRNGVLEAKARPGRPSGLSARRPCSPLIDKQIPEQTKELGISEEDVIENIMLRGTIAGEHTSMKDVAAAAASFASFESNALTSPSLVVGHAW